MAVPPPPVPHNTSGRYPLKALHPEHIAAARSSIMAHHRNRAQGGVLISSANNAVSTSTASVASSDTSTPPPSDSGSSDTDANYFTQYKNFTADPDADFIANFTRLAIDEKWSKKVQKKRRAEAADFEAARFWGTDLSKLEKWQELCREVGIEESPPSITKCKKALARVYVNIFNIIDHRHNPERFPVIVFPNHKRFRQYTLDGRIYPLNRAKQDTFIKALLRPLFL